MLTTVLVATRNRGKVKEIREMLAPYQVNVLTLADLPDAPEVVEDGVTFEENAAKKAREMYLHSHIPTLADDSGLVVDALGGAPGVRSARYAGEPCNDADNNTKLLGELELVGALEPSQRTARFVCAMAFSGPTLTLESRGEVEGFIAREPAGNGGFGYDPLFVVTCLGRTAAQLPPQEKNAVSHRGAALAGMLEQFRRKGLVSLP